MPDVNLYTAMAVCWVFCWQIVLTLFWAFDGSRGRLRSLARVYLILSAAFAATGLLPTVLGHISLVWR